MANHLLTAFAEDEPERFSQLLGNSTSTEETIEILTGIPDGLECDVIARLTPRAAERLLGSLPDEVAITWLASCPLDGGRRMLSRIDNDRAERLLAGLNSQAKRRQLRRLVDYPAGSVGQLMQANMLCVNHKMPVADITEELRLQGDTLRGPIAVLSDAGAVTGTLNLVKFIQNKDADAIAADSCDTLEPGYVETSPHALMARTDWNHLPSIPLADHRGKPLGYVTRVALERAMGSHAEPGAVSQSVLEVSRQFLQFMIFVTTQLLGRGPNR